MLYLILLEEKSFSISIPSASINIEKRWMQVKEVHPLKDLLLKWNKNIFDKHYRWSLISSHLIFEHTYSKTIGS